MNNIKEIEFDNCNNGNIFFDLVDLQEILNKKPNNHSQFKHHRITFYAIIIINSKKGKHCINFKDFNYKKGTIFTLRKDNIHKFYKSQAQGKIIVFSEDFITQFTNKTEMLKLFQLFNEALSSPKLDLTDQDFSDLENLLEQIETEYLHINDSHSINIIRSLIQLLIQKIYRHKSKLNDTLNKNSNYFKFYSLQTMIEEKCFESKKASFYAEKMGVTTKTLNNITRNVIGKNTKLLISEIVILQIKRLLMNTEFSMTEIAYKSGFNLPTNFFKYFKNHTGISPKDFRSSCN